MRFMKMAFLSIFRQFSHTYTLSLFLTFLLFHSVSELKLFSSLLHLHSLSLSLPFLSSLFFLLCSIFKPHSSWQQSLLFRANSSLRPPSVTHTIIFLILQLCYDDEQAHSNKLILDFVSFLRLNTNTHGESKAFHFVPSSC
jgi:hypothetical protein